MNPNKPLSPEDTNAASQFGIVLVVTVAVTFVVMLLLGWTPAAMFIASSDGAKAIGAAEIVLSCGFGVGAFLVARNRPASAPLAHAILIATCLLTPKLLHPLQFAGVHKTHASSVFAMRFLVGPAVGYALGCLLRTTGGRKEH